MKTKEPLSGFVNNKCFSAYSKEKQPYSKEKSKSKDKKKDYSDARKHKRGEE